MDGLAPTSRPRAAGIADTQPAGDELMRLQADDAQWVMPAKNYASTRYRALADIDVSTVRSLQLTWTFSTGALRGHEAAPLVLGPTMFVVTPFPNILYALDLARPGAPIKWKYQPKPAAAAQGIACCDVVNRGRPTPPVAYSTTPWTTTWSRECRDRS
jgi:lanthanide-dependent methanol dehydrogenase